MLATRRPERDALLLVIGAWSGIRLDQNRPVFPSGRTEIQPWFHVPPTSSPSKKINAAATLPPPASFPCSCTSQHDLFLRDKPNLLSEIRRATHYGVTPEKQEVDDLRSEVGSLRLQVTDMDGRIDALSRMVDQLLEERSAGAAAVGADGSNVKHEIPPAAGWAKKRRLDGEWDGTTDLKESEGGPGRVVRTAAGPPCVKMESGEDRAAMTGDGGGAAEDDATVRVKAELSEGASTTPSSGAAADGMIIGGGALSRNASFLRDLDNMSIGSVGSIMAGSGGSLGPLELIDVASGDDGGNAAGLGDVMSESFFDMDFEAEITSMPGSEPSSRDGQCNEQEQQQQQQPQRTSSASDPVAAATQAFSAQQSASSPPAAAPATALAATAAVAAAAVVPASDVPAPQVPTPPPTAAKTPEIAMPLASAALGAFMVHYANAKAVKEPSNAVAAVAMDTSRHALERTTSLH